VTDHDAAYGAMLLLNGDDVDRLATMPVALAAAEEAARLVVAGNIVTGRVQVNGPVAWMRVLAGMVTDLDLLGYKEFHRVGRDVRYHVHLYRESTGDILGVVDGRRITSLRTAATAAAAVRHWASGEPVRVGLIGSGEESREGLRALAGACAVTSALVYSPTPANREAFAREMSAELGLPVTAAGAQPDALADVDVAYIATSSHHTPFLTAADVAHVGMVAAIGSTQPVHRELTGDVFLAAARTVVDTPDATHESGDCIEASEAGWDRSSAVLLGDYLRDPSPVRDGMTIFKSVGSVEQDLVLAYHLLQAAANAGAGRSITDVASLRVMR
jgi:ornithine cyclodeaminase/alanine dehydrogenase-like protein (mu-crystallin family)